MIPSRVVAAGVLFQLVGQASPLSARPPLTDSTDVRIADVVEHESSVFVSPLDPNAILVMSNGAGPHTSTDGGLTWSSPLPPFGGDPAVAIIGDSAYGPHGRFVAVAGAGVCGTGKTVCAHMKSFPTESWTTVPVSSDKVPDRTHVWVDNSPFTTVLPPHRLYASWNNADLEISGATSDDGGVTWTQSTPVQHVPSSLRHTCPNLRTGRTGRAYHIWARQRVGAGGARTTESFGFTEGFGAETVLLDNSVHDANSAVPSDAETQPSMAVDKSDPTQDRLFVVWADRVAADRVDVLMLKGTTALPNGPVVWDSSNVITVNQYSAPNVLHWWPWITWDDCTGMLAVVFMEKIGEGATVNTIVAVSENHGTTWAEFKVSDVAWGGTAQHGYDYIGIASGDGRAFPVWSDPRQGGEFRAFTSPFLLWGVSSVIHTIVQLPGNVFRLTVTWTTNLRADAGDTFVLTPPPGIPFGDAPVLTISADGKSHTAVYEGPCVPSYASWTYVLSSRRGGCQQSRVETRAFKVQHCVD